MKPVISFFCFFFLYNYLHVYTHYIQSLNKLKNIKKMTLQIQDLSGKIEYPERLIRTIRTKHEKVTNSINISEAVII